MKSKPELAASTESSKTAPLICPRCKSAARVLDVVYGFQMQAFGKKPKTAMLCLASAKSALTFMLAATAG